MEVSVINKSPIYSMLKNSAKTDAATPLSMHCLGSFSISNPVHEASASLSPFIQNYRTFFLCKRIFKLFALRIIGKKPKLKEK